VRRAGCSEHGGYAGSVPYGCQCHAVLSCKTWATLSKAAAEAAGQPGKPVLFSTCPPQCKEQCVRGPGKRKKKGKKVKASVKKIRRDTTWDLSPDSL